MEGLIPFIYKTIKEPTTRSYSRCSFTSGFGDGARHGGRRCVFVQVTGAPACRWPSSVLVQLY
jgi:hypothetical protein